ncbi:ribosomal protein L15 [Batrachochytrium salamandrivorans]|nr:ribosomal protein L15 [Batrachochytrium salamandrivorans]
MALSLNNIRRSAGSTQQSLRVGRGVGSGVGGTSRRGHKGQRSRTGSSRYRPGFEGGQTPFWRRVPKSGFTNNRFKMVYREVNLGQIQDKLDFKLLDASRKITIKDLVACGLISRNVRDGVKLLGRGRLTQAIDIEVTRGTDLAMKKVEAAGGKFTAMWYTHLGLRALLFPFKFDILPRSPRPPNKFLPYYTSNESRGYLSPLVQMRKLGLPYTPVVLNPTTPVVPLSRALRRSKA